MRLSNIANVIDLEFDGSRVLEIGLTTVDLNKRSIIKSYSFPIKVEEGYEVDKEIIDLTGWTTKKLNRQGFELEQVRAILTKHGFWNRLIISDCSDELDKLEDTFFSKYSPHKLNISILFSLRIGQFTDLSLDSMLEEFNLKFEGRKHSAKDDSYNIARVFLELCPPEPVIERYARASQALEQEY